MKSVRVVEDERSFTVLEFDQVKLNRPLPASPVREGGMNTDGFGKSPDAALRFLPRRCGVRNSTPHSSGFARLACGAFSGAAAGFDASPAVPMNTTGRGAKNRNAAIARWRRAVPPGSGRAPGAALRTFVSITVLALLLFAGGCAGLPSLKPLDPVMEPAVREECRSPFLPAKYRLVHSLSALVPGGGMATAIGVLVADPQTGSFRSVLMTLEGWVLFDIEGGATLRVHRAVPPFDPPAFARRMAEDIGLAFFAPGGEPVLWGEEEKGFRGCRYGTARWRICRCSEGRRRHP